MPPIGSAEILAEESDASEYCWGEGLEPDGLIGVPPSAGGRYTSLTPPCEPTIGR